MQINFNLFPGGRPKALTMSYDDGVRQDIRLIEIFNKYGIKGTFHINAGCFGADESSGRLSRGEILKTYAGHEIAAHGYVHQCLAFTPREQIVSEAVLDREALEDLVGAPVRGMSYAYGSFNENVVATLRTLGIDYCRTTRATGGFGIPADFLQWDSTCHHKNNLLALADRFIAEKPRWTPSLMYVWGHSYEFDNDNNWDLIESFCEKVSGKDDIWYATNIEISDYLGALRRLRFTMRRDAVYNPTDIDVWISVGKPVKIGHGEVVRLV